MNVEQIKKLNDEGFRALVDSEIRNSLRQDKTKDQLETERSIRDPSLNLRWGYVLTGMKKNVESQLGAKKADLERVHYSTSSAEYEDLRSEYFRWRGGALRFKNGVEDRLLEVRAKREMYVPDLGVVRQERNEAIAMAEVLRKAIANHQSTVLTEFEADEVSDADRDLWKVVG